MQADRETEEAITKGKVERIVKTMDHHSSAGHGTAQKPTQIIHQSEDSTGTASKTSGGVLANAAASIVSTLESTKEALSGRKK